MNRRERLNKKKRVVIKVGSSTLSFPNGRINLQRVEELTTVLAGIHQNDLEIILVTSGAVAIGGGILGVDEKPADLAEKQALAAIGQSELIKIYQKFFEYYKQVVAQVLLTKDGITNPVRRKNAFNTLSSLLEMNILPIINENDTVSTHGVRFGNNDVLSAHVAELIQADLLIMLSDIDGLFTEDPKKSKNARFISTVTHISQKMEQSAKGSDNSFGTGGMATKLDAVKICFEAGIDTILANGKEPGIIKAIMKGEEIGTYFTRN
jgi:glutamate 5-kinase